MNMGLYGYPGKIMRADLTNGVTRGEVLPPQVIEGYIGGVWLGAKYLQIMVSTGVQDVKGLL